MLQKDAEEDEKGTHKQAAIHSVTKKDAQVTAFRDRAVNNLSAHGGDILLSRFNQANATPCFTRVYRVFNSSVTACTFREVSYNWSAANTCSKETTSLCDMRAFKFLLLVPSRSQILT